MSHNFPYFSKLRQIIKFCCLFILCITLTISCQSSQPPTSPSTNTSGRISIGTTLKARTIDPADSYEVSGLMMIYNLGESLYTYKLGTTILEPLLASAMPTISPDGLTYRIPVRQNVVFHDGTPFDAAAMAFSLNRFIQSGGKPSFLLGDIIEKVSVTEPYEVQIKLKKPFSAFTALLAFPGACAVSPAVYEIGNKENPKFKPTEFVGTGPYKLTTYENNKVIMDVFEDYWGKKPENKGINLQIYQGNSATNLFNGFRTQDIDVAYQTLVTQQVKVLQEEAKQGKWQVIERSGTNIAYLTINVESDPLRQKALRQAIAALIDRKLLNERILRGQSEPLYSLIPKTFEVYKPAFKERYGDADLQKAKELIAEAGFTPENPAIVEIWHTSSSINSSIAATVIKALAKRDLGGAIQFQPNNIAGAVFFSKIGQGLYQTAISGWYPDFLDPDNYISPFLSCDKGSPDKGCQEGASQSQGSFYYSDRMNRLIEQQRKEQNPEKRKQIFAEIQDLLAEDAPYIPLWQSKNYAFAQKGVQGIIINPSQTLPFWTLTY